MGLLRNLFGPSRKEIWREFSSQIGAQYVEGGFWNCDKVQARHDQWTVTVDTYTESHSSQNHNHSRTYTRLRAPYVSRDGFRFTKDIDRLKSLYYLFAETLNQLCQIGSASEDDPGVEL